MELKTEVTYKLERDKEDSSMIRVIYHWWRPGKPVKVHFAAILHEDSLDPKILELIDDDTNEVEFNFVPAETE